MKGLRGGNCNRTACQREGAIYYNHSTRKYYCPSCALLLNRENRQDALKMFGHELCTIGFEDAVGRFGDALSELDEEDMRAVLDGANIPRVTTREVD